MFSEMKVEGVKEIGMDRDVRLWVLPAYPYGREKAIFWAFEIKLCILIRNITDNNRTHSVSNRSRIALIPAE